MIRNLKYGDNRKVVTWENKDKLITKNYNFNSSFVILGNNLVLIVEPIKSDYPNNAVIYDENGDLIRRVQNPCLDKNPICFDSVYESNGIIILIAACARVFYECRLNSSNGDLFEISETR